MLKNFKARKLRSEKGAYIIFTLIFLGVLILLTVFLVGLGYRSGNRVLLKNQANLVALAAIEGFISDNSSQLPYNIKATKALERANFILSKNNLKGVKGSQANDPDTGLGILTHHGMPVDSNSAGEIELGTWLDKPKQGEDPCNLSDPNSLNPNYDIYPCFKRNSTPSSMPPTSNANAVRVRLRNQTSNPILAPFVGHLGYVEEESYGIMVPRCTASLIDLSYSAVSDSHPALPADYDYSVASGFYLINPTPPYAGMFAFPNFGINAPLNNGVCGSIGVDGESKESFYAKLFWCQMPNIRNLSDRTQHFKSDFELENTDTGEYYIDKYVSPEPFTRYLNAFNAAFRLIKGTLAPGDKSLLAGFNGEIATSIPPLGGGLTTEIDYLIQISNPTNVIGTKSDWGSTGYVSRPMIYPNFLNEKFIPKFSFDRKVSGTNLIGAIFDAASRIGDRNSCDESAKKSIIIATDGVGTCRPKTMPINGATQYDCAKAGPANSAALIEAYMDQEDVLLNSIKQTLIDQKISLTVMLDGAAIGLHYLDIRDSNVSPNNDSDYLTFDEARSLGYGVDPSKPFFNTNPICPVGIYPCNDEIAISKQGEPGYQFRRPSAALGKIAFETGGMLCPLLEPCTAMQCPGCGGSSCYTSPPPGSVPTLKDCARSPGAEQRCSYYGVSKSQQAALCARQAVGGNPFALRQPTTIIGP